MARPERFELPTLGFVDRCSIQLSYGRIEKPVTYIDSSQSEGLSAPFPVKSIHSSDRIWRRERDSNPRWAFDPYTLSRGAPSTTRPSLRCQLLTHPVSGAPFGARYSAPPCASPRGASLRSTQTRLRDARGDMRRCRPPPTQRRCQTAATRRLRSCLLGASPRRPARILGEFRYVKT